LGEGTRGSVAAAASGQDYQARYFWIQALRLLEHATSVDEVAFEHSEEPHFDDVVSFYKSEYRERDDVISAECAQLKFHVTGNESITLESFVEPRFMGSATTKPLIKRLAEAYAARPDGQFKFVTTWSVHPDDGLSKMLRGDDWTLRLDPFFAAGDTTELGRMRKAFRAACGLDDAMLSSVLSRVQVVSARGLRDIDDRLNDKLRLAGLEPYEGRLANRYDRIPYAWIRKGPLRWGRETFQHVLRDELGWSGLFDVDRAGARRVGVRQFVRFAENLGERVDVMLDLVPHFDDRRPAPNETWNGTILPRLADFVKREIEAEPGDVNLCLAASLPIAFALGASIHPKSPVRLRVEQSGRGGSALWTLQSDAIVRPHLTYVEHPTSRDTNDIAVLASLTHSIYNDVKDWLEREDIAVKLIIEAALSQIGGASVENGAHCMVLAEQLAARLTPIAGSSGTIHLFLATPAAFAVALGRAMHRVPRLQLYEFDFEHAARRAYSSSILLERT